MNQKVKLSIEKEGQQTALGKVVDVHADFGTREGRIASIYHESPTIARHFADMFCMLPAFAEAITLYEKYMQDPTSEEKRLHFFNHMSEVRHEFNRISKLEADGQA